MEYYVITLDFKDGGSRNFLVRVDSWREAIVEGEELLAYLEAEDFTTYPAETFVGPSPIELCTF